VQNAAKTAGFLFGNDTALVAVQHMLKQTVDLFQNIGAMGLDLKNIFALGKVYSNSAKVMETLRSMGITVVESVVPPPGEFHHYFEQDTDRLWQVAAEQLARRNINRVLVLDDGGVCITSVPPEVLHHYSLCGVEQTSLGMFLFEEKPPPVAVMAWARSAVKLEIGGPIFSRCFIDRFITEFLRHRTLTREQLGIIGMGSVGRAVASLAVRQGNDVLYYDPNKIVTSPHTNKLTRLDSLEELMVRCDYVVGCSGRNPFNKKWPLNYKPGIKLLSASGGDQEFSPIINDLKQKSDLRIIPETWDLSFADGPSGPIQIAYMGYPYNFVLRAVEAVPTRIVQLETGGLLAALVQARMYLDLFETNPTMNRGIYRVSPKAQRFVFEKWLQAMRDHDIDIVELFGYDQALLNATKHDEWFAEESEPHKSEPVLEGKTDLYFCRFCGPMKSIQAGR
jgi:hypothetical protein